MASSHQTVSQRYPMNLAPDLSSFSSKKNFPTQRNKEVTSLLPLGTFSNSVNFATIISRPSDFMLSSRFSPLDRGSGIHDRRGGDVLPGTRRPAGLLPHGRRRDRPHRLHLPDQEGLFLVGRRVKLFISIQHVLLHSRGITLSFL